MNFVLKNKTAINIVIVISIVLDLIIAYIINKLSSETFDFFAPHNIVVYVILALLIIALVVCKLIELKASSHVKNRKLQKAFQENGGYEAVVDEMKNCIKNHDLKSMKDLKKMVDIIEK